MVVGHAHCVWDIGGDTKHIQALWAA